MISDYNDNEQVKKWRNDSHTLEALRDFIDHRISNRLNYLSDPSMPARTMDRALETLQATTELKVYTDLKNNIARLVEQEEKK